MKMISLLFGGVLILAGCASRAQACGGCTTVVREVPWVVTVQNKDGSWGNTPKWYSGKGHPGYTALAIINFLNRGETPLSERYGKSIQDGMRWLAEYGSRATNQADVAKQSNSAAAKSHALATIALVESLGMTSIPFLEKPTKASLKVILSAQLPCGGFAPGLNPKGKWDTTLSAWCTFALLSAKACACGDGPELDKAILRAKTFFAKTSRLADGRYAGSENDSKRADLNATVMGNFMYCRLGIGGGKELKAAFGSMLDSAEKSLEKLVTDPACWKRVEADTTDAWFCARIASSWVGIDRKKARSWRTKVEKALRANVSKDGAVKTFPKNGFEKGDGNGRLATTLMFYLILDPPRYDLPMFNGIGIGEDKKTVPDQGMIIEIE